MSQRSYYGRIENVGNSLLTQYCAVSAYMAHSARNNLAHLIDEFTQTRVNFVSDTSANLKAYTAGGALQYSFPFVHTWFAPSQPANLAVYARMKRTVTDSIAWEVNIRSFVQGLSDPADIAAWSGSVALASGAASIELVDDVAMFDGVRAPVTSVTNVEAAEPSGQVFPLLYIARIDVRIESTFASGEHPTYETIDHYLSDLYVREFA